jgi:hypothetical protein
VGVIEDAECAVAGVDQDPGLFGQMAQELTELDIGRDHENRRHQSAQFL